MSRRLKILIIMGVVLVAAMLVSVIHHYQLRAATEAYIAELKAKGEPLDLAWVLPPPVPQEQNSAAIFLKAASLLDTNWNVLGSNPPPAMRMVAPGKAMIGPVQTEIRDGKTTNSWEDIASALAQENEALNLLRQITNGSTLDFGLTYSNGVDKIQFSHLAPLKRAAQGLSATAISDLHHGDAASAVKNIRAMLALSNGMSHDRLIISELVRMAITQMALSVSWELLQSTNVTDSQLATLQHDWSRLEFIRNEENALAMERVTGEITLAKWRGSSSELQHYFDAFDALGLPDQKENAFDKFKIRAKVFLWRYWWSYPDEIRTLKGYEVLLQTTRSAGTNYSLLTAMNKQKTQLESMGLDKVGDEFNWFFDPAKMDMHSMLSQSIVSLDRVFNKVMTVETAKQMTITAIALKRYQMKHGNFPADLTSLVPEFLSEVPRDPIDGQSLRYRQNADGTFLLYSLGEDGKDDGGDPKRPNSESSSLSFYWRYGRDWVWPQPATPEEIQKYYDEQAKKTK